MSRGKRTQSVSALDPQALLTELTALSRRAGLYVDLGIGREVTLRAVDLTTLEHWSFYWDKERKAYRFSPEDGLDEP
jgi:predicted RNA-binding protein (virulence factor B family)